MSSFRRTRAPRWHRQAAALFEGIDHTAIVVRDTVAGLAFFQGTLGLEVHGHSENYGVEQEHLNNVFGARLLITSLGAAASVELLDYLAPTTGRSVPVDSQANDLWQWHINMVTSDIGGLETRPREAHAAFVSLGIVDMPDDGLHLGRALMARSPEGHAILAFQPRS